MVSVELTQEQQQAVDKVKQWYADSPKQTLTLGGYAGTGKTTVIKAIMSMCHDYDNGQQGELLPNICAFTGKAVSVLRKKGVSDAQTMHSLMYTPFEEKGEIHFERKTKLDDDPDLIIVDEASMVSTELNNDLLSFGKKILYVGDPGQLEPIGDNPGVMNRPEILLNKIHRQAVESKIIQASIAVRDGKLVEFQQNDEIHCGPKSSIPMTSCLEVDQVICAFNKARDSINKQMRDALGFKGLLQVDEKLICLRNDSRMGIYNGQTLAVTAIGRTIERGHGFTALFCQFRDDLGHYYNQIPVLIQGLLGTFDPKTTKLPPKTAWFDYGYCITCHKSQGSEWDSILVFEQASPIWNMNRWRYTAVTRAAKRLIYVRS